MAGPVCGWERERQKSLGDFCCKATVRPALGYLARAGFPRARPSKQGDAKRRVATVTDDAALRQGLGNHRVGLLARDAQMARHTVQHDELGGVGPQLAFPEDSRPH